MPCVLSKGKKAIKISRLPAYETLQGNYYMKWFDYVIIIIPMLFVMGIGYYSRRYIRGVVDFLSAGRLCGRYLLTVGDIANGISIVGVLSYVERKYQVGFAVDFWNRLTIVTAIIMALSGYCVYRFRETKAQSIGQFLEMRYGSKLLRFYFSFVRVLAEMLAHSIMPAVAARFFMYFLNLPENFQLLGITFSTYATVMVICMTMAILLICWGGTLTMVLTDTLQGLICVPIMVILGLFLFSKFDWATQILPVISDRVPGESFINSFDINKVRDFNLFAIVVSLTIQILNRAAWLGGGASGAARTPHEQKMAGLLGHWRGILGTLLYTLLALSMLVMLNCKDFSFKARNIRTDIASRVTRDILSDPVARENMIKAFTAIPVQTHIIGQDTPSSRQANQETIYLETAKAELLKLPDGRAKIQEFNSLYRQQMMSVTLRHMLGSGLLGLFALLMVLAMVSTDDSYIFSSAQTIAQDLILPFFRKVPSARLHIWLLRGCAIFVGGFFLFCSLAFAQLDFIELFRMTVLPIYIGGSGPVLVFGLYSRFGTRQGAWTSILSGTVLALFFILCRRNWADIIYPWLETHGWVTSLDKLLSTISAPFSPYIVWRMDAYKFPINGYESSFIIMMSTLILYIVVSRLTCREPFNLERMLHRGIYSENGNTVPEKAFSWKKIGNFFVGITPQHSKFDKVIAWALAFYSYIYTFLGTFLIVVIWNSISLWPKAWWGTYFFIVFLAVPLTMACITAIWFWVGGLLDIRQLLRDLKDRVVDQHDNGMVINGVALSDVEKFKKAEEKK